MSIDVCIKQKGLFKKTIPLDVIVGDELAFGINDGMRMVGDDQEGNMIFYNPNSIGRGFHISWDEEEKNELNLRLLNPTTTDEMRSFFNCLRRITSYWKCSVTIDGIEEDIDEYLSQEDDLLAFNHRIIKEVSEKIANGETDSLTLMSTMWPLVIGKDEAERFILNPHLFSSWMHELQSHDYYYAKPQFFKTDQGIKGIYALTEDCPTLLPNKPWVPVGYQNPETGEKLECDYYEIALYSTTEERSLGTIPFERIFTLGPDYINYYDGNTVLVNNLPLEVMKRLEHSLD